MYLLKKELIGAFMGFVPTGSIVDGITVGIDAYPDVDPAENWNDLGCIQEVNFETETEPDTDYCPSPSGGYDKDDDENVVADTLNFISRDHSEPIWRMLMGLKNPAVNGVAQAPFAESRRYIEGWLKVQGRGTDGTDRIVMNVYGRLSLDGTPKWSKDPTKPALKFKVRTSPIATVTPQGISAA